MGECRLCGKKGKNLSLFMANHKDLGSIMVCQDCWVKLYEENRMVCGTSGGSAGGTCPACGS
ncbi:MAG: hypothetical protein ACXQTQ_02160 [Candidatus Hecatellaceae archaeon]|nr:MAG: hypothetical protein DRO43_05820 [Candidatus Hecatellales archaeon]